MEIILPITTGMTTANDWSESMKDMHFMSVGEVEALLGRIEMADGLHQPRPLARGARRAQMRGAAAGLHHE